MKVIYFISRYKPINIFTYAYFISIKQLIINLQRLYYVFSKNLYAILQTSLWLNATAPKDMENPS